MGDSNSKVGGCSQNPIVMTDFTVFVNFACYCTKVIHVQSQESISESVATSVRSRRRLMT